jgi:hypothetical protein
VSETADALKELFAIPAARITRDLAAADPEKLSAGVLADAQAQMADPGSCACDSADHLHRTLLLASATEADANVPREVALHQARMAAGHVADLACELAVEKGRIGELSEFIESGDRTDEELAAAEAEADGLFDRIHDTMLATVLRRYNLRRAADLFETDRAEFDRQCEAGRRLIFGA